MQSISEAPVNMELFAQNFDEVLKEHIPNSVKSEEVIHVYNDVIRNHNIKILTDIDNSSDENEIAELRKNLIDSYVLDFTGTEAYQSLEQKLNEKLQNLKTDNDVTDEEIERFKFVAENIDLFKDEVLLAEILMDPDTKIWETNSDKAKENYKKITENGLLVLADLTDTETTMLDQIVAKLDTDESLNSSELELLVSINNTIFNKQSEGIDISNNENIIKYNESVKTAYDEFNKSVEKLRPDFLNIKNIAFETMMSVLEGGINDNEIFLSVQEIYQNDISVKKSAMFKNASEISDDRFVFMLDQKNAEAIAQVLIDYGSLMGFENISIQETLDLLTAINDGIEINEYLETINDEVKRNELESFYDSLTNESDYENTSENISLIREIASAMGILNTNYDSASLPLSNKFAEISTSQMDLSVAKRFLDFVNNDNKLLNNPIYEFLRNFSVTLDPSNRVSTILDILETEEVSFKGSSGASNFSTNGIRSADIETAVNVLGMIRSIIFASTSTEVTMNDIVGFLGTRQDYARKTSSGLDVLDLQTLTTEEAQILVNDINRIVIKLEFLNDLAKLNQTRAATEEAEKGRKVDSFKLNDWKRLSETVSDEYIPIEVNDILKSSDSDFHKLIKIEDLIFEHNQKHLEQAFSVFLSKLPNFSYTKQSDISIDIKESGYEDYDRAIYFAVVLASHSSDW